MEVSVRGKAVLVTTHKTYKETEEANGIVSVCEYAPFKEYIAGCESKGPAPRAIIIRTVFRMAHRVVGVIADVEYADPSGLTVSQSIHLTDAAPAVLLPVAEVDGRKYGILHRQRRLPVSLQPTNEAFYGTALESGEFTSAHDEMLKRVGFDLSTAQPLSEALFTIGNEGKMGYKVFTMSIQLSEEQLNGIASAMPADSLETPVAVPLEVVRSMDDAKAALAASLLIVSQ